MDDDRSGLERRLIVQAEFLRELGRYPSTEEVLREAAESIGELGRALVQAREALAPHAEKQERFEAHTEVCVALARLKGRAR